jgi:secretion/DNA translocation related TadE-like protein
MRRGERGAGSALAVGLVAAVVAAALLLLPLAAVLEARQRAVAAADAAALAGADTALGLVAGVPCHRAAIVARADGAVLARCAQRGLVVRVETRVPVLGFAVGGTAVAGPSPDVMLQ